MKEKYILDSPSEIIEELLKYNPYVIKVKCVGCSETKFAPYIEPSLEDDRLKIGNNYYPIKIIEKVTIRCKKIVCDLEYTVEVEFKVSSKYIITLFNEEIQKYLIEFPDFILEYQKIHFHSRILVSSKVNK